MSILDLSYHCKCSPIDIFNLYDEYNISCKHKNNVFNLTRREIEVIELVSQGLSNTEIASILNMTLFTLKTHLSQIYDKLEVSDKFHNDSPIRLRAALTYLKKNR